MMKMRIRLCSFFAAATVPFEVLSSSAQTGSYLFTGSEATVTLNPGFYEITAYGAQGGGVTDPYYGLGIGGAGAEMSAEFSFAGLTTLTLLVGGTGQNGSAGGIGGSGGGGGSFVVNGTAPLVVAGGGGGGCYNPGAPGLIGTSGGTPYGGATGGSNGGGGGETGFRGGGGGGGFYLGGSGFSTNTGGGGSFLDGGAGGFSSPPGGIGGYSGGGGGLGGYGGGGGGGGSFIDASAVTILTEFSGVASPDGSPNGEIIITAIPEPSSLALLALSGLVGLPFFGRKRCSLG